MLKRNNFLVILIVLLAAGIFGILWFYNTYLVPNAEMSSTYMEVYQNLDASEIRTINIDTINNKVKVVATEGEKVKISYYERIDSANSFVVDNKTVSLKIIERTETPSNKFISQTRQIDTITIYIPQNSVITVNNKNFDGSMELDGVSLNSLVVNTITGSITVKNSMIKVMNLNTNSGDVMVTNTQFDYLGIDEVTGKVTLNINDSLKRYNLAIKSVNGFLTVNNDKVKVMIDDVETVVNYIDETREETDRTIRITSLRSNINVTSNEEALSENENESVQESD
ncbi:MAG: DUF4097 family beta strand repeat protein [Erysipelotrichaceae bacterium]|nr:DUF4097 family beta strand repeat protein [Erysipelotrichaceae bacterium]